jgi:hypothetical protein
MAAASADVGKARSPKSAQALELDRDPAMVDDCIAMSDLRAHFGDTCKEHESEGGAGGPNGEPCASRESDGEAGSAISGDIPLGNNPTCDEVLWYCDERTVVRVALTRCTGTDRFKIAQIAVSIH